MNVNVLSFLKKVNTDNALSTSIMGINVDQLVTLAAQHGFEFTSEDWQKTVDEIYSAELNESQLDNVAGGAGPSGGATLSSLNFSRPGAIAATGMPPFAPGVPSH